MRNGFRVVGFAASLLFGASLAQAQLPNQPREFWGIFPPKKVEVVNLPEVQPVEVINLPDKPVPQCATVENAHLAEGLIAAPPTDTDHVLVELDGPGCFLSARVIKQGGDSNLTFVTLEVDGQPVMSRSVAALLNWGLVTNSPAGIAVLPGTPSIHTVTVGFPVPLTFQESLVLSVSVGADPGIAQIIGNVVVGD